MGATRDDIVVMMEKIAQQAIIKIEERSHNNGVLIDGWRGWMLPTAEKRGAIVDALADDCGGGIEFLQPLDNGSGYWQWCGGAR